MQFITETNIKRIYFLSFFSFFFSMGISSSQERMLLVAHKLIPLYKFYLLRSIDTFHLYFQFYVWVMSEMTFTRWVISKHRGLLGIIIWLKVDFVLVVYYMLDVIDITLKNGSMEFAWAIILKTQRLPKWSGQNLIQHEITTKMFLLYTLNWC